MIQFLTDRGLLPVAQPSAAGHAAAAAQLLGKVFPANPALQHEQDARKDSTVSQRLVS